MEAFVEVTSMEAFVEAFVEAPAKVTCVEDEIFSISSMETSTEASMKASVEVTSMKASVEVTSMKACMTSA